MRGNSNWGIPERHHAIANVFVDGSLLREDGLAAGIKQQVYDEDQFFRLQLFAERREILDIHEHHGDIADFTTELEGFGVGFDFRKDGWCNIVAEGAAKLAAFLVSDQQFESDARQKYSGKRQQRKSRVKEQAVAAKGQNCQAQNASRQKSHRRHRQPWAYNAPQDGDRRPCHQHNQELASRGPFRPCEKCT